MNSAGVPGLPWQLDLGEPFDEAKASKLVAPARLPDGTDAVVKVYPSIDVDSDRVADALRFWDGDGVVRVLAADSASRALLLERCRPGRPLGTNYDEETLTIVAGLMRRLWREPPPGVPWARLDEEAEQYRQVMMQLWLPEDLKGRGLLEEGLAALDVLLPIREELVLCHQDLHGGNILSAQREPWLAIDPMPIVAERAYDAVAIVRHDWPEKAELQRRLDAVSDLLELDRERMRLWGLVKCLVWGQPYRAAHFLELGSP